jgi:uncharacterized protein (TIGR03085 family)
MTTDFARAERLALCDLFVVTGPDAPTLCEGWATRDLAAHLVIRERRPDLAAGMFVPFLADRLERAQDERADGDWARLIEEVRTGPPFWNPMSIPAIDEFTNLVEFVIHHEDVLRGDGTPGPRRVVGSEETEAIWSALRRMAPLMFRRSEVGVTLLAPGRTAVIAKAPKVPGREVIVSGEPIELLLTAYGRARAAHVTFDGSPDDVTALKETELGLA